MHALSKIALAAAGLLMAAQVAAEVTFYEHEGFAGRSFTTQKRVNNLARAGFNDRASSVVVAGGRGERWEVCEDVRLRGRCVVLRRGQYPSLAAMGLNDRVSSVRAIPRDAPIGDDRHAPAPTEVSQVTFYEHEGFQGRNFTIEEPVAALPRAAFNDRASSAVVRGERWEVCEDTRYRGRCVVLRRGQYPSLAAVGLNDRISSLRPVSSGARIDDRRYAPPPMVEYDYGRRPDERLYQAEVTSVRAVLGTPEQRCWIEREQVSQDRSGANVPGAIVGAVIGGILGHQVGGGSGKDVATAIGVVGGAAVGANVNRGDARQGATQNVQRCTTAPSNARPDYWDVTYDFRGQEHRVQMTQPPGRSVTVNERGEPRA
jgi:uncharacterized protein YcfJ